MTLPPPYSIPLADLMAAARSIHERRRYLLVAPADVERVEAALRTLPWDSGVGLLTVRAEPLVPEGTVYVFDPNAAIIQPPREFVMGYPHFTSSCHEHHDLVRDFDGPRPQIVVLCGSTRFVEEFNQHRKILTEAGEIVLSIEVVTTQAREDDPQHADPDLKTKLDDLHKRKIDLADYVLVLDVGGYIGESTASEIAYAVEHGKPVHYLSEADPTQSREGIMRQAMDKVHADYGDAVRELGDR